MALKYQNVEKKAAAEATDAAKAAEYKGSWGEIAHEETRCIHFVRNFHGVEEIWTYPYDALLRWVFRKYEPEEIEILAGGDTIKIIGYDMERLVEAMEKKRLRCIEQRAARFPASEPDGCCVTEIKIESSRA
jgi:hypothetical protein